ncbi:acyl-CoA dehydrogenase family protein [Sporichthya polymorpha]|uniref:acyl-CoA dehydrogenase family protein n=1 Tax=Sporichthya polymorpha TaxID=35751 RepID=UPI000364C386|nr:acyl-CoA dehydrogenase family protein [Sporichthya polymorpha]
MTPADELRAVLATMPDELRRGPAADFDEMLAAQRWLASAGWVAPGWPVEHGGRGLGVADRIACDAEYAAADVPLPAGILGLANVGPALMEFGTAEQQAHLPRILDGSEIWCQGFSEPGAGSDLAGLRTRARPAGESFDDGFVIDGQKVWTSHGMHATHCMLLVRTDPDGPKHKGISVLLVPMDSPGIERRPIRMISGDSEFAEVFFTGVRVAASALLGPLHGGWGVTVRTLVHERTGVLSRAAELENRARQVALATTDLDPLDRDEVVRRYVEARVLGQLGQATLARGEAGQDTAGLQALIKLSWGLTDRALAETALDVVGLPATVGSAGPGAAPSSAPSDLAWRWLNARASTIAAGTTEVLKDLVAERVLGLPRS